MDRLNKSGLYGGNWESLGNKLPLQFIIVNSHHPTRQYSTVGLSCVASASGGMNVIIILYLNVFRLPRMVADSVHTARRDSTRSSS